MKLSVSIVFNVQMIICRQIGVPLYGIGYNEIAPLAGVTGLDGNKERIFLAS